MIASEAIKKMRIAPEAWGASDDVCIFSRNLVKKIKPENILILGASNIAACLQDMHNIRCVEEEEIVMSHIQKKIDPSSPIVIEHMPIIDCDGTQIFDGLEGNYDFIIVDAPRFAGKGRGLNLLKNNLVNKSSCTILWIGAFNFMTLDGIKEFDSKFSYTSTTCTFEGLREGIALSFI